MMDSLPCGGAEKSLISLLPFLAERDYKITLMLKVRGGLFERYVPSAVKIVTFPYKSSLLHRVFYSISLRLPWNRKRHSAELYWSCIGRYWPDLKEEYDVAIAYQQGFPTFYISEKVNAIKKFCWVNTDLKAAGYSPLFCAPFYKKYNRIAAVADSLVERLVQNGFCNTDKIFVVLDILNEPLIREMAADKEIFFKKSDVWHITTVGRLVAPKGYDIAIDAAKIMKEKGVNFVWHIVGGGQLQESLSQSIEEYGLTGRVILEGEKLNPYPYIRCCDIYVQTSKFEGFGLTVGEAKILGKPIVSTNFPVIYNQISDGQNGLVVEMTGEAVADGIMRLITDPDLKDRLADNVLKEHNTTAETESAKVIQLIEEQ